MEAFDLTGSNLSITGGFNYLTGKGSGSNLGGQGATLIGLPWLVTDGVTPSAFGTFSTFGSIEGTHYTIGDLDLSSILAGGESFHLHATMRCGNDVLWGYNEGTSNVPDGGAAVAMLGLGVGAVGLLRRRVR